MGCNADKAIHKPVMIVALRCSWHRGSSTCSHKRSRRKVVSKSPLHRSRLRKYVVLHENRTRHVNIWKCAICISHTLGFSLYEQNKYIEGASKTNHFPVASLTKASWRSTTGSDGKCADSGDVEIDWPSETGKQSSSFHSHKTHETAALVAVVLVLH